jgi:hypothetical protein
VAGDPPVIPRPDQGLEKHEHGPYCEAWRDRERHHHTADDTAATSGEEW